MKKLDREHSYLFLAALVVCSLAIHVAGNILWHDVRLVNEPLHATAEAIGAAIALFMTIVLLWERTTEISGKFFLMAMGFLWMGLLDGFHAASSQERGFVLLRSAAGLSGGFWFSLIWLPGLVPKEGTASKRLVPWMMAGTAVFFGLGTMYSGWPLPEMLRDGKFTAPAVTINLLAGILFAVAAVRFIIDFHHSENPVIFLFACMATLFSIAQFSFPFSVLWDTTWWLWHALRLMAYILVLGFAVFERKQAEDEIKRLNQDLQTRAVKLEEAYRDMESFSYSASHDLRSPLIKMYTLSRILQKDYADRLDENGGQLLNDIQENVKKMEQLINDLLAFSRVSTQEIRTSEINMDVLTREVFEELSAPFRSRSLHLEMKGPPSAYGDQSMMRQVLANLLSNAIKFTKPKETAVIEVGGTREENENIYYVKDNGAGFDMENADKLFTIFQRLHDQKDFEGTGIGLVIVKRVIEKHGGRVWAEGKPDEGATFYFVLPGKILS